MAGFSLAWNRMESLPKTAPSRNDPSNHRRRNGRWRAALLHDGVIRPLLLLALLFAGGASGAAPPTLQELDAASPLRLTAPTAFIAAVRAFESKPKSEDARNHERLRLLVAKVHELEGRFDEAIAVAEAIADGGIDPASRLRAGALVVRLRAASRHFGAGQGRLEPLLEDARKLGDPALQRYAALNAAMFYRELAHPEAVLRHSDDVLTSSPNALERCMAMWLRLEAQQQRDSAALSDAAFAESTALCDAAGAGLPRGFLDLTHARWLLAQQRLDDAAALLSARLPAISATADLRLRAKAHATLAESLQRRGNLDAALREADAALALSAALSTNLPLLQARRTRYAIAIERGQTSHALRELQAVIIAERAYAEEMHHVQDAYQAGRNESVQRQQAAALLDERIAQLALEAQAVERRTALTRLLLFLAALGLLAVIAWAVRSRVRQRALRQQMRVDSLTGLHTRAYFSERAATALASAQQKAVPLTLVLIDLDHFSYVNARFGHLTGDGLLEAIGRALRQLEDPQRNFGRLGGEEFAILLPGAGLDEGLAFAERCREAIAATAVAAIDDDGKARVTASFGVASTTAVGYRLRDLLAHADEALYRAKRAGRNRVSAAVAKPTPAVVPA